MKRTVLFIIAISLLSSCGLFDDQSKPEGYVRHCVRIIDRAALYADSPEWKQTKQEVLAQAKTLTTLDEAHEAVSKAAKVAGGKHSFLMEPVKDTASYQELAPSVKLLEGNIAHIVLPAHSGVKVSDSLYTHTVLDFLQTNPDLKGVVLDLRDNRGGNMYPMIAAVSPLLPDGILLKFQGRKRTFPISLDFVLSSVGIEADKIEKFPASTPIAILTNDWTGSSGEATLLCFRGLPNVRTFGIATAGYASANMSFPLLDGYTLVITTSCDVARTGEVFCDDGIEPDITTKAPLEDALVWISEQ